MSSSPFHDPERWQAAVEMPVERRGGPLPFWPCGYCREHSEPVEERSCFAAVGQGALHIVGCKLTGELFSVVYPNERGLDGQVVVRGEKAKRQAGRAVRGRRRGEQMAMEMRG